MPGMRLGSEGLGLKDLHGVRGPRVEAKKVTLIYTVLYRCTVSGGFTPSNS